MHTHTKHKYLDIGWSRILFNYIIECAFVIYGEAWNYSLVGGVGGFDPEGLWTVIYINIFAYTTPQGWIALGIITVGTIGYEVYKYWDDFGICYSKGGKQNIDNEYVREVQRLGLRGGDICSYLKTD